MLTIYANGDTIHIGISLWSDTASIIAYINQNISEIIPPEPIRYSCYNKQDFYGADCSSPNLPAYLEPYYNFVDLACKHPEQPCPIDEFSGTHAKLLWKYINYLCDAITKYSEKQPVESISVLLPDSFLYDEVNKKEICDIITQGITANFKINTSKILIVSISEYIVSRNAPELLEKSFESTLYMPIFILGNNTSYLNLLQIKPDRGKIKVFAETSNNISLGYTNWRTNLSNSIIDELSIPNHDADEGHLNEVDKVISELSISTRSSYNYQTYVSYPVRDFYCCTTDLKDLLSQELDKLLKKYMGQNMSNPDGAIICLDCNPIPPHIEEVFYEKIFENNDSRNIEKLILDFDSIVPPITKVDRELLNNINHAIYSKNVSPITQTAGAESLTPAELNKLSETNDPISMHHLALAYYSGDQIPKNRKKAIALLEKSKNKGYEPSAKLLKTIKTEEAKEKQQQKIIKIENKKRQKKEEKYRKQRERLAKKEKIKADLLIKYKLSRYTAVFAIIFSIIWIFFSITLPRINLGSISNIQFVPTLGIGLLIAISMLVSKKTYVAGILAAISGILMPAHMQIENSWETYQITLTAASAVVFFWSIERGKNIFVSEPVLLYLFTEVYCQAIIWLSKPLITNWNLPLIIAIIILPFILSPIISLIIGLNYIFEEPIKHNPTIWRTVIEEGSFALSGGSFLIALLGVIINGVMSVLEWLVDFTLFVDSSTYLTGLWICTLSAAYHIVTLVYYEGQ